jgi:hypothetical protein
MNSLKLFIRRFPVPTDVFIIEFPYFLRCNLLQSSGSQFRCAPDASSRAVRGLIGNDPHLRALIEGRMGPQADWNAVDSLMKKALAAAEKVARYRHAQLAANRGASNKGYIV